MCNSGTQSTKEAGLILRPSAPVRKRRGFRIDPLMQRAPRALRALLGGRRSSSLAGLRRTPVVFWRYLDKHRRRLRESQSAQHAHKTLPPAGAAAASASRKQHKIHLWEG